MTPSAATLPSSGPDLRHWLRLADDLLTGVERVARELRGLADTASSAAPRRSGRREAARTGAPSLGDRALRVQQTGTMLTKLVLGYRFHGLRTAFASERRAERMRARLHKKSARRFARTSAQHGGAFLKVGQLLSTRADLLPDVWVRELATLQDAAPPIPAAQTRAALHAALGASPESCFAALTLEPIAAASIGQVHRGRTHDGLEVAVKLQRPGIRTAVDDDLAMLAMCIDAMRGSLPALDLDTIVREIRDHVRAEVDYVREAALTLRASQFFARFNGMCVPEPVSALCSASVLTTRFIEGRKITTVLDELAAARDAGSAQAEAQLSELLGRLLQAYLRQVLQLGVFQADPHPGNLLVTPAGEVAVLDFGCAGELSDETRRQYIALLQAFFMGDRARMAEVFLALGFRTQSGRPDTLVTFMDALLGEVAQAIASGAVTWPSREELAARMRGMAQSMDSDPVVTVPGHFVMVGRVLGTLGGMFAHYRPQLDVGRHVLPVLADVLAD